MRTQKGRLKVMAKLNQIGIGDRVVINRQGTPMLVVDFEGLHVTCAWKSKAGLIEEDRFRRSCLTIVEKAPRRAPN